MRFCVCLGVMMILVLGCGAAMADEPKTARFEIGALTVWSIADAVSDRDMSVFMADQEIIDTYAPTGKSPSAVLAFVVLGDDYTALIDTGYGRDTSLLLPGLSAIGIKPESITTVLITHMHGDHIGGLVNGKAKAFPNARVLVAEMEYAFWLSAANRKAFPDRAANFALAKQVADAYGSAMAVFSFDEPLVPGISSKDAVGHTPGHTAFMIESGGDRLLCVADLIHSAALQFPRPDINSTYDMNPEQARATRERMLKLAAEQELPIAGMHLPFPGIGRVRKAAEGYVWQPE